MLPTGREADFSPRIEGHFTARIFYRPEYSRIAERLGGADCQAGYAGRTRKCNFWDGRRIAVTDASQRVAWPDVRRTEPGEMPEAEAIRLAQQGDAAAFERLYRLHSRRVYSLCLRMVGNTAEAEDLTQEAFLQLFRKIATFRGESAFSTWLHRLAVNVVLMKLRKKSGNETVSGAGNGAGRRMRVVPGGILGRRI